MRTQIPSLGNGSQLADTNGKATFSWSAPAPGETWTGTLQAVAAPGGARFTAYFTSTSAIPIGSWIGDNPFGPVQARGGQSLFVAATGLQPGVTYVLKWTGEITTNDDSFVSPAAATSIAQQPNALYIGTDTVAAHGISTKTIAVDSTWRAVWVVVFPLSGGPPVPTVVGVQSTLAYAPLTPPYFSNGNMYRFAMLGGVDTSLMLTVDNSGNASGPYRYWWGADLDTVDSVVYSASGSPPSGGGGSLPPSLNGYQTVVGCDPGAPGISQQGVAVKGIPDYFTFFNPSKFTFSNIDFFVSSIQSGGWSNCFTAIYNQNGTQIALSSDFGPTLSGFGTSVNDVLTVPLSFTLAQGIYTLGFLIGASSIPASNILFACAGSTSIGGANQPNINLPVTANTLNQRTAAFGSGQNALPSPFVGTLVQARFILWAGLR